MADRAASMADRAPSEETKKTIVHRRRRVSIAVHTATQATSSHRTKTTKSEQGQKHRLVVIDDPKALPGASFLSVCCMCLHYAIMAFLFISGAYHNDFPAPMALFLIPAFMSGVVTVVGLLCFALQRNKYISKLIEPTTGMIIAVGGTAAGAAWSLIIYAPLRNDFTLAIQFTQTSAVLLIYYLLVRRRLVFASRAFYEGAHAVARVRAIFFRVLTHSVFLLVYTSGWCLLYMRLIDVPPEEESANGNSTVSDPVDLPKFISTVNDSTKISAQLLRPMAKAYMIFNLFVISQSVKASVWMTVSEVATSVAESAREGVPVVIRTGAQLNTKLRQHLPSVFLAGHFLLISQLIRGIGEAFHRCRPRRAGVLHNVGALILAIWEPLIYRFSSHGLCRMERTGLNIIKSSLNIRDKFQSTGMSAVVNDDVLFGSRMCSCVLFASVCSIVGSFLVEIFQYPKETTLQISMLCFVSTMCIGNWGMECAEAWVICLFIEFAEAPETIYVSNPSLANYLHSVFFGCSHRIGEEREKEGRKRLEEMASEEWREQPLLPMEREISGEDSLTLHKEQSDWSGEDSSGDGGGMRRHQGKLQMRTKGELVRLMSKHFAAAPSHIRRYSPNAMTSRIDEYAALSPMHQLRRHTVNSSDSGSPSQSARTGYRRRTLDGSPKEQRGLVPRGQEEEEEEEEEEYLHYGSTVEEKEEGGSGGVGQPPVRDMGQRAEVDMVRPLTPRDGEEAEAGAKEGAEEGGGDLHTFRFSRAHADSGGDPPLMEWERAEGAEA